MKTKLLTHDIVQEITPKRNTTGTSFAGTATTFCGGYLDIGISAGRKKGGW